MTTEDAFHRRVRGKLPRGQVPWHPPCLCETAGADEPCGYWHNCGVIACSDPVKRGRLFAGPVRPGCAVTKIFGIKRRISTTRRISESSTVSMPTQVRRSAPRRRVPHVPYRVRSAQQTSRRYRDQPRPQGSVWCRSAEAPRRLERGHWRRRRPSASPTTV